MSNSVHFTQAGTVTPVMVGDHIHHMTMEVEEYTYSFEYGSTKGEFKWYWTGGDCKHDVLRALYRNHGNSRFNIVDPEWTIGDDDQDCIPKGPWIIQIMSLGKWIDCGSCCLYL